MANYSTTINLYSSQTGLTLKARLYTGGVQVGSDITTGFTESEPDGAYEFETSAIPDDFQGIIRYYDGADNQVASEGYNAPPVVDLSSVEDAISDMQEDVDAVKAKTDTLGGGPVTVTSPVAAGGDVTIIRGDDYLATDGRALEWTSTRWPDLTGAAIRFKYKSSESLVTITGSVVTPTGTAKVRVELAATDTSGLSVGENRFQPKIIPFDLEAVLSDGSVVTLVQADMKVVPDAT
jgi:hypothetical protein